MLKTIFSEKPLALKSKHVKNREDKVSKIIMLAKSIAYQK